MIERFDEIAGDYNHWLDIDPDYHEHHRLVMEILRVEFAGIDDREMIDVLEVGCGTGYTSRQILATDTRVRLCAADNSVEMLRVVAKQVVSRAWPVSGKRLMLQLIDVLSMLHREAFNTVVSVFMLHNLPREERRVAVANMTTALKPGGLLIIGDKVALDDETKHQQVMSRFWEVVGRLKSLGSKGQYDYWRRHNEEDELMRMTEGELADHLRAAGLQDISVGSRCGIGMYAIATARKPR